MIVHQPLKPEINATKNKDIRLLCVGNMQSDRVQENPNFLGP
jgi:hypothetical protein